MGYERESVLKDTHLLFCFAQVLRRVVGENFFGEELRNDGREGENGGEKSPVEK